MSANIQVSAFRMVPPFAQGFVRDLRIRWALGEARLPYEAGLARTTAWVIAALNSIEPWSLTYVHIKDTRAHVGPLLKARLGQLSDWLGDKEYLEGRFTAGDLIMATVLREIAHGSPEMVSAWPNLDAYRRRCLARPAFGRALEAQLQVFRDNAPPAAQAANA